MYFNRDSKKIDVDEWMRLRQDDSYRVVAKDHVWAGEAIPSLWCLDFNCLVSTVWMGLSLNHNVDHPLIFETMAFSPGSWDELLCERARTVEEAKHHHQLMVNKLKETVL